MVLPSREIENDANPARAASLDTVELFSLPSASIAEPIRGRVAPHARNSGGHGRLGGLRSCLPHACTIFGSVFCDLRMQTAPQPLLARCAPAFPAAANIAPHLNPQVFLSRGELLPDAARGYVKHSYVAAGKQLQRLRDVLSLIELG